MNASLPETDLLHVLERTPSIWAQIGASNIFITGGSGFVGRWLLETFLCARERLRLGARLFVLTRDPQGFATRSPHLARNPGLVVLPGDLKTFSFPAEEFGYVIHAAMDYETVAANVTGAQRILHMAETQGARRLLYLSSGAVYGEQPADLTSVAEDFVPARQPASLYAQAKTATEALCLAHEGAELAIVVARLFTFAGPHLPLDKNFAIGNFVRDALAGGPIRITGDGTPLRSYLYAADLAIWLWTLLVKGAPRHAYNVGSDSAVSILDLAKTVARVCGVTREIALALPPASHAAPPRYVPSIQKARAELGLEPWIALDDAVRRMFDWFARVT